MSTDNAAFAQLRERISGLAAAAPVVSLSDKDKVASARQVFVASLDNTMAVDLEACVHCGMCAEVCHFYEGTRNARYAPVRKYQLLRKVYRRELAPLRFLYRLLSREITVKDLEDYQELVFDSCTECGRCDMVCPIGIRISALVDVTRQGLSAAGLAPDELQAIDHEQTEKGTILGIGKPQLLQVISDLNETGIAIPLDKAKADVMVLSTAFDIYLFRNSLAGTAKILNKLNLDWTLRSDGFEAANFGFLSGNKNAQKVQMQRIVDAAVDCQAKTVVVPECGHAYQALRWEGANAIGQTLPFEVLAIAELIGREISAGRLKINPIGTSKKVTYHDPCKLGRHSGVFDEPRQALAALGVDFIETESHRRSNYCCGGGAGGFLIGRAASLRQSAFELKKREVDNTGADSVVTTCDSCRFNFMSAAADSHWDTPVESLVELVAANLAD